MSLSGSAPVRSGGKRPPCDMVTPERRPSRRRLSMPSSDDWRIPREFQPDPAVLAYDLERALSSVVSLRATIPDNAYTAEVLGTERSGQGAVIRDDGLVLTIGYLI